MKHQQLFIDHAYWTAERKRLQEAGSEEMSKCDRVQAGLERFKFNEKTCIESVHEAWRSQPGDPYSGGPSFEEDWLEAISEGSVCEHCINVRDLRKQRMAAGRKLGGIRSAITRIGQRLAKANGGGCD
ncbi:hypothetical protein [Parahaliea mediterranea]|uniref:hypothetical protein n=1 Tax=Parahaliea mediterranea TaxID=651086 RepID=UPI000E2F6A2E|nr:hypothetical protein [Parahaliea mediterranea]